MELNTSQDLENAFHEWNTHLYRYVYARIRDQGLAEDIVQEVFLRAWQYRKTFDKEKSSLKNWLYTIATNIIRDYFRKNKILLESEDEIDTNLGSSINLEKDMEEKDLQKYIFEKVKTLPEREQEMLSLRYVNDLSVKEISEILNKEYSATKVAFHRAIKKLQVLCEDYKKS